jgi:hypothetical protein
VGRVACMPIMGNLYRILIGKLEGKRPFGIRRVDGRIILNFFFHWLLQSLSDLRIP